MGSFLIGKNKILGLHIWVFDFYGWARPWALGLRVGPGPLGGPARQRRNLGWHRQQIHFLPACALRQTINFLPACALRQQIIFWPTCALWQIDFLPTCALRHKIIFLPTCACTPRKEFRVAPLGVCGCLTFRVGHGPGPWALGLGPGP